MNDIVREEIVQALESAAETLRERRYSVNIDIHEGTQEGYEMVVKRGSNRKATIAAFLLLITAFVALILAGVGLVSDESRGLAAFEVIVGVVSFIASLILMRIPEYHATFFLQGNPDSPWEYREVQSEDVSEGPFVTRIVRSASKRLIDVTYQEAMKT